MFSTSAATSRRSKGPPILTKPFWRSLQNNMDINVGDTYSTTREVTEQLINEFAELSGDHNPIHLDEEFAKTTRFGRRIAHGMLSGAFISAVLGYEFKERKIVYLSQTMKFIAPVYIGDTITT